MVTIESAKAATKKMMTVGKTFPCRTCKKGQPHVFIGEQEFPGKRYALWNCCICGDTRADRIYDAAEFSPQEESELLRGTGRL